MNTPLSLMQTSHATDTAQFMNTTGFYPKGEELEHLTKTLTWYRIQPTDDGIMLPHMGVLINTIKGFRIVSIFTKPEWRKNDSGYFYCHPIFYRPEGQHGWLPKKSKKYTDEFNYTIAVRLAEISHKLVSGDKTYNIARFNCQHFSEGLINGYGVTNQ